MEALSVGHGPFRGVLTLCRAGRNGPVVPINREARAVWAPVGPFGWVFSQTRSAVPEAGRLPSRLTDGAWWFGLNERYRDLKVYRRYDTGTVFSVPFGAGELAYSGPIRWGKLSRLAGGWAKIFCSYRGFSPLEQTAPFRRRTYRPAGSLQAPGQPIDRSGQRNALRTIVLTYSYMQRIGAKTGPSG